MAYSGASVIQMGKFIVFEGIDGAGKSSLCKSLSEYFNSNGISTLVTQEPTEEGIGAFIRSGLTKGMSQEVESLLFVADRAVHTERISQWLKEYDLVLCDRYFASTVAYQSAPLNGKGVDRDWLIQMNLPVTIEPDITFLMDVDPDVSLSRIARRNETSKFESSDYLSIVRENYLRLADEYDFEYINASRGKDWIFKNVSNRIKELI